MFDGVCFPIKHSVSTVFDVVHTDIGVTVLGADITGNKEPVNIQDDNTGVKVNLSELHTNIDELDRNTDCDFIGHGQLLKVSSTNDGIKEN